MLLIAADLWFFFALDDYRRQRLSHGFRLNRPLASASFDCASQREEPGLVGFDLGRVGSPSAIGLDHGVIRKIGLGERQLVRDGHFELIDPEVFGPGH